MICFLARLPWNTVALTCAHAGDTVNIASRMETTSFPLAIQVSQAVVDAANKPDQFHPLGARKIKGKGDMPTWLYKV